MPKKRHSPEGIIHKRREADVLIAQHKTIAEVCKQLGVTDPVSGPVVFER